MQQSKIWLLRLNTFNHSEQGAAWECFYNSTMLKCFSVSLFISCEGSHKWTIKKKRQNKEKRCTMAQSWWKKIKRCLMRNMVLLQYFFRRPRIHLHTIVWKIRFLAPMINCHLLDVLKTVVLNANSLMLFNAHSGETQMSSAFHTLEDHFQFFWRCLKC